MIDWYLQDHKVGLDIDDVLSDFCPYYCNIFAMPQAKFWNFDRQAASRFSELIHDKDFWLNIPVKTNPDTIKFEPHCYITSRSIPKEWTEQWLDNNGFATVPVYQVGIDGSKGEISKMAGIDIFIDDRFSNFIELNRAGIFTYLFDAPHNRRYDVGKYRIYNVNDIIQ